MNETKAEPEEFPSNQLDIQFSERESFGYTTGKSVSGRVLINNTSRFEAVQLKITLFLRIAATLKNGDEKLTKRKTYALKTLDLISNSPRKFASGRNYCLFSFPTLTDGEVIHYLKVNNFNSFTFDCRFFYQTYRLEVEMETFNGTMKVEFPVIFGYWRHRPDRKQKPYNAPANEAPRSIPSASQMEDVGAAPPPTYEEAMRDTHSYFYQPPAQQASVSKYKDTE